jgi:cytosine/adenosine deaminase-related metal-dependent hydrolase
VSGFSLALAGLYEVRLKADTTTPPEGGHYKEPQIMQVTVWATHGELKALVASGLTPYRALRAGTINVARFFGTADHTGTVAVGKEASLVLVDANPLENVANMGRSAA